MTDDTHRYLTWCTGQQVQPMNRTSLNSWIAGMLANGSAGGTARIRQQSVRRFAAWLIVEGRLSGDPFWGVKAPKLDQSVVEPLTDDELRALIGGAVTQALRRYLPLRDRHRFADSENLWLGERGRRFGYDGLSRALRRRAHAAGIAGFHPHKLRHTAAHRWLASGGSESGLMAMAGWTRTDMLVRYTASERAAHEARRLNLGEL